MSPIKKKKQPIKKKPSQPEKVSQGQNLAKGNVERAARLEHLIAREGYTALNQAIMGNYIFINKLKNREWNACKNIKKNR